MAKGKDEEITSLQTPWEGIAGKRVEEFIKKVLASKVGYLYRPQEKGSDNNYHLYGFATEEDYNEWNSDPDANSHLLLTDVALPESGGGGSTAVSYIVGLTTGSPTTIVTTDNTVKIKIRFTSEEYNPLTQSTQPTTEGGTLTIQTRLNSSSTWRTRGTIENIPSLPSDSTDWTEIDITSLVDTGTQQVRMLVKGDTTELNTRYLQFTVTKTSLGLTFASQWERAITDGVMHLSYYVSGAVSKTLHIRIDGKREIERNIGTAVYTETPIQIDVTDTFADPVKVLTHGIHEIEAWISVNDSTIESEHLFSQVMVVADPTDTTTYLLLNGVKTNLSNWTRETILSYAVYNPSGATTPLKFSLENYNGDEQYMTLDLGLVPSETRYTLTNVIEIDSDADIINAYMRFYSGNAEIHPMMGFVIDNSENFSPTANPDFVLNPRSRTNEESNPKTIINTVTGEIVPSTWLNFGMNTDGWVEDNDIDKQRCLRVPAGRALAINYEAFKDYLGSNNRASLTIELDYATRNATSTDIPVLQMCSYDGNDPLGFEVKPWEACFMTAGKKVRRDQDVMFQEGVRTHMAVNIIYGINGSTKNYVRIFVNGVINREFEWEESDAFVQYVDGVKTSQGIRIGSTLCDIDVYGIRIYNRSLSATDIRQDRMASLPTVEEKLKFRAANDILDDSNLISYTKTREKYNTIVIKTNKDNPLPCYSTGNIKVLCDWDIHIVGDPAHSGLLTALTTSGQGTSSRSYWDWNQQGKTTDETTFTNELGEVITGGYALDDTVPLAAKLVAKINWASSQQSHKLGSCNLYNDLWRVCTGGSSITQTPGFEKCRVTVKQKPFFLFEQYEDGEPVFRGLATFGPGKGDKPTFGYDKKVFPDYLMIEGCDNGEPLTNHRIPWNNDITIGGDEDELMMYNGSKQWEIDMGNSDSLPYFQDAFNFIYLCTPHIRPFVGTLAQLQLSDDSEADKQKLYWVTQASGTSSKFDLYRYDALTSQWVDAGVAKLGSGRYAKLNLSTQLSINPSGNVWNDINQQFVDARIAKFKREAANYFKLDDAFYHQMFIKLIAASDNRAKNTYMYLATYDGGLKIHFAQDDLDTVFLTDNVGRKGKPYYVEEHDRDENGDTYWNGEANALYDLIELAFPFELRAMMKSILTAMANLASDKTLMGCMEDYFFYVQRYFPAVAYNETARLRYETAAAKWGNGYTASTHPITQSLGDQLEGEMQWMKLRLIYLSSFASYGAFTMNGEGSLAFRSATNLAGSAPSYSFELTPHMWLYPAVSAGSSTLYGRGNAYPQRVKAGEKFILDGVTADNDTNVQIHGIHYYTSIGEFGDKSLSGTFTVAGERLTEFHAAVMPKEFRPTAMEVTAPNLRVFDINGASTVAGNINFNAQTRLEEIDMRGTSVATFNVKEPTAVTKLYLPASLTSLTLDGYLNLEAENFLVEGFAKLQTMRFHNCPNLNSQQIVSLICGQADKVLSECVIDGINWSNFSLANLEYLASIRADLTGVVAIQSTGIVSFALKKKLVEAWGDIDNENNKLYLTYTKRGLTGVTISGDTYISKIGRYKLDLTPSTTNANDFTAIKWSISKNTYASIDERTGELTVNAIGTEEQAPTATVTVEVTLIDGSKVINTKTIGFYDRTCKLGDYVFADGTFSDVLDPSKTVVGICFYINRKNPSQRLCVMPQNLTLYQWGLYPTNDANGIAGIQLQDSPGYNVYDIPTLSNISNRGITGNYINEKSYRDETSTGDPDGFKVLDTSTSIGEIGFTALKSKLGKHEIGEELPYGYINTLRIIQHRDMILGDSAVNLPIPSTVGGQTVFQNLMQLLGDVVADNDGLAKYRQFYYPAASECNAYEPGVRDGEALADCFKQGKWFLPSEGELSRLYWWHRQGYEPDGEKQPIFAQARNDGRFTAFTNSWYWSSTECSQNGAWGVGFSDGGASSGNKFYSGCVRAVAAF